jgi:Cu/Ag efflux pump CusA
MTALSFILGVVPLTVASGAGAAGQNSIGTGVFGGMLGATLLAVFFVPMWFYLIDRIAARPGLTGTALAASPGQTPPGSEARP